MWLIRPEQPDDYGGITKVHEAAFAGPGEARLVQCLRKADGFDVNLSLVAVQADNIVGHILFSPIQIETASGNVPALSLAPMAVLPTFQRQGIGSALACEGLDACRRSNHAIVVVLGHANYYPRFGFVAAGSHGLTAPFPVPDEAFMALALTPGALDDVRGVVRYPPAFDDV